LHSQSHFEQLNTGNAIEREIHWRMLMFRQTTVLSLEGAMVVIQGAIAKAKAIKAPECIAVVDTGGNLLAFARMDNARLLAQFSAMQKAVTAVSLHAPTGHDPQEFGLNLALATGGRSVNLQGGLPLTINGEVVGAIGVGSGTPEQDIEVAQAGASALEATIVNREART